MSYQHLLLATVLLASPTLAVASGTSLSGVKHTWSNDSGGYKGLGKSTQQVTVMDADATWRDGVLYLAAIVTDGAEPEVIVASGDPDGALTEVTYPYASHLDPHSVGITTGDDRLVLAVSGLANDGSSDALGWLLLGWN